MLISGLPLCFGKDEANIKKLRNIGSFTVWNKSSVRFFYFQVGTLFELWPLKLDGFIVSVSAVNFQGLNKPCAIAPAV
jgi:hypothetical protein